MQKKWIVAFIIIATATIAIAHIDTSWITRTDVWEYTPPDSQETYVYAVGSTEYPLGSDSEFYLNARTNTELIVIRKLQEHLKVNSLIDFQTQSAYENNMIYVLGIVPKSININRAPPPPLPFVHESGPNITELGNRLTKHEIKTHPSIPADWYDMYNRKDPAKNVFRVGNYLYSIGAKKADKKFRKNPSQYWQMAAQGAKSDAQRNFISALGPVVRTYTPTGWEEKINNVTLKNAYYFQFEGNPHNDKKTWICYILYYMPLKSML